MNLIDWLRANYNRKYKLIAELDRRCLGYFLLDSQKDEYLWWGDIDNYHTWETACEKRYTL